MAEKAEGSVMPVGKKKEREVSDALHNHRMTVKSRWRTMVTVGKRQSVCWLQTKRHPQL